MHMLCFVLMPFGRKPDPVGGPDIDFDRIYKEAIEPAIRDSGLDPIRADHEVTGGIIHKPMFERLLLCDFAIADLTTANANVFYELGVRHAARPRTTLPIFAAGQRIPFDVHMVKGLPYSLGPGNRFEAAEAEAMRSALIKRLKELRDLDHTQATPDSPILHLLQGYKTPDLAHLRTELVEKQLVESAAMKRKLREARSIKPIELAAEALASLEAALGDLRDVEAGLIADLYLSYRAVGASDRMLALYEQMPRELKSAVLVREQRAFALNRKAGKASGEQRELLQAEAEDILKELVQSHGPNAETCGLLGRIYKDRWEEAAERGSDEAAAWLLRAIAAYQQGFEADWRDSYPGINAATLLEVQGTEEALRYRDRILPVVRFAAEQRLRGGQGEYWDYATLVEAAVLARDYEGAASHLANALASVREYWEPETTSHNLGLIERVRRGRDEDVSPIARFRAKLEAKVDEKRGASSPASSLPRPERPAGG
jgi:hypothetical protein